MSETRDTSVDARTNKDIFEEARDRLKLCLDAESKNRTKAKNAILFREGFQWDDAPSSSVSQDEIELTINLTDAMAQRIENNIKQQRPRGKCHPVGDGANTDLAQTITGLLRHVEYRSDAGIAYDQGAKSAITAGWGYWRILSEYEAPESFNQELRISPIRNIFSVYMDPSAIMPTGQDAMWGFISAKIKRTEHKRLYPRVEMDPFQDAGTNYAMDWEDREDIRVAEYFRITERAEKLYRIVNHTSGHEYTRFHSELPNPTSLLQAGDGIAEERDSSRRRVEWFRLNGTKVIDKRTLPISFIPIIRVEGNAVDADGQIIRRGMVQALIDPQRMVNYGEVAKIKRLGLAPKAPWVAAEGQLDGHPEWDTANTQSYSVLTYKPVTVMTGQGEVPLPPPQRQPPAGIEAGFAEFVQGMRTNLLAVAGMPNEPGADAQGEVVSGKALKRRQFLSDQSHFQYYDNLTLAIAHTWRIGLEWAPHVYKGERIQRIIGEDGTPEMVEMNKKSTDSGVQKIKNDLTVGRYDVVMDTGPGYETKREEGAENLISLLKIGPLAELVAQHGADLVFRSIDHPYMQELADRIVALTPEGLQKVMDQLPERARAVVRALSAQIDALKKQLETTQADLKHGITKAHLKAETDAHDTEETNKTRRIDTQIKSHTAISVAEIQAGASLLNTHTEAKYHEREAERMIEQAALTEKGD
jgi:hypothetical protein